MFEWIPPKPPPKPRPPYKPFRVLSKRPWTTAHPSKRKLHPKNWQLDGIPRIYWPHRLEEGNPLLPPGRKPSQRRTCFWCNRYFYTEMDPNTAESRFCCRPCHNYFAKFAERWRKNVWLRDLATQRALEVAAWRHRVREYKARRVRAIEQIAASTDIPIEWLRKIEKRGFATVTKELLDMAEKARLVTETRYHIEHTIATELPRLIKLAAASLDKQNNPDVEPLSTAQVTLLRMLLDKVVPNASSATMQNSSALLEIDVDTMDAAQLEELARQTAIPIIDNDEGDECD